MNDSNITPQPADPTRPRAFNREEHQGHVGDEYLAPTSSATTPASRHWTLYWADRNSRWHRYDDLEATPHLDELITEIDEDPTCIFFG